MAEAQRSVVQVERRAQHEAQTALRLQLEHDRSHATMASLLARNEMALANEREQREETCRALAASESALKAARAATRKAKADAKEAGVEAELRRRRVENEAAAAMGAMRDEHRRERREDKRRYLEIEEEALQLHENVARLEDQIALLRSSRLGGLKKELEEKDALVKELRQRRGAGQRTLAEANLDKRRAKLAQEKAKKIEEAFQQLAAGEAARHANEPSLQEAQAHVEALQEQLDRERALRIKYEAIIKPPKEYFFVNGHFLTEVDLTALEVSAGTAQNALRSTLIMPACDEVDPPHLYPCCS